MVSEDGTEVFVEDEKFSFKSVSGFFSLMFNDLSSPHSNILPSSETIEKSLLLYQSIMLSIMYPIIQRYILNRLLLNISRDSLLAQRKVLLLLVKLLYFPLILLIMFRLKIGSQIIRIFRPLVTVEKLACVVWLVLQQGYDSVNIGPGRDLKLLVSRLNDRFCAFSGEHSLLCLPDMRHLMDFLELGLGQDPFGG